MDWQFAIDKSAAAVYEGIAILKIEEWYQSQGLKVHARYNEENGLEGKRGFDLVDTYGKRWEVKADRLAATTGNVFFEHIAVYTPRRTTSSSLPAASFTSCLERPS